jgi:hypothetical protein
MFSWPPSATEAQSSSGASLLMAENGNERRNYRVLLAQGILNTAGYQFTSEKLVLPFLYTAAGLPAVFSGLLVPIAAIAKLGARISAPPWWP